MPAARVALAQKALETPAERAAGAKERRRMEDMVVVCDKRFDSVVLGERGSVPGLVG